jgi:hypothetical protein
MGWLISVFAASVKHGDGFDVLEGEPGRGDHLRIPFAGF